MRRALTPSTHYYSHIRYIRLSDRSCAIQCAEAFPGCIPCVQRGVIHNSSLGNIVASGPYVSQAGLIGGDCLIEQKHGCLKLLEGRMLMR